MAAIIALPRRGATGRRDMRSVGQGAGSMPGPAGMERRGHADPGRAPRGRVPRREAGFHGHSRAVARLRARMSGISCRRSRARTMRMGRRRTAQPRPRSWCCGRCSAAGKAAELDILPCRRGRTGAMRMDTLGTRLTHGTAGSVRCPVNSAQGGMKPARFSGSIRSHRSAASCAAFRDERRALHPVADRASPVRGLPMPGTCASGLPDGNRPANLPTITEPGPSAGTHPNAEGVRR